MWYKGKFRLAALCDRRCGYTLEPILTDDASGWASTASIDEPVALALHCSTKIYKLCKNSSYGFSKGPFLATLGLNSW